MVLPEAVQNRISALNKRLKKCKSRLNRLHAADRDEEHENLRDGEFLSILRDTCALIQESEATSTSYCLELSDLAHQILEKGIQFAYGDGDLFDFMPSWAHDDQNGRPLIQDHCQEEELPPLSREDFFAIIRSSSSAQEAAAKFRASQASSWNHSMKRHPKSTTLARFRPDLPALTPTSTSPLATSMLDARCEISSTRITSPIRLQISRNISCLALIGMGGWKNQSPVLNYFLLDKPDDKRTNFPEDHFLEPGLAGIARHMSVDETRQLIFVGDDDRVKSYAWAAPNGTHYKEPLPTHTLDSGRCSGPILVLPNGTIVRAGKGKANVWEVGQLKTHGKKGRTIIGKKIAMDHFDSSRDDPENIEPSSGSAPSSQIEFIDQINLKPHIWQPLIEAPSTVICAEFARESNNNYGCIAIDLNTGKTVTRYLGHGATMAEISVSTGDPQVFITACHDGFARLYDVRRSLPVTTIDACGQDEPCEAVSLAHPDGIPIAFTGTYKGEQIKIWDIRARTAVYELATGNNAVLSLAWDPKYHCLYAATECAYMDRIGNRHGYRRAKILGPANGEDDMDEEDDEEDDGDGDNERCWPKAAWHNENYFGYAFDAGDHRIYRYAFKEGPDTSVVPEYGDAGIGESYW